MTIVASDAPSYWALNKTLLVVFAELSIMYGRVSIGFELVYYRQFHAGRKGK